jgi:hypothetical protein
MRFVSSVSCALITIGILYLDNPAPLQRFVTRRADQMQHAIYDKVINYGGLSLVRREELDRLLPMQNSVPWWLLSADNVESTLLRHSLVKKAELRTCDRFAVTNWGCFEIQIEERRPSYAALIEDEVWILGQDGGLLFPVAREKFESESLQKILSRHLARDVSADAKLKMLQIAGSSPDLIHARLEYTRRAVEIIEKHSKLEVALARCSHDGEIRARFEGYPFEVLFDYRVDAPKTLTTEAERLAALIKEFGARVQTIELIDLAYNKLAIVRFQEGQERPARADVNKTMFTKPRSSSNLNKNNKSVVKRHALPR